MDRRPELAAFGLAVRQHRLRLKLSQEALAERSELHRTYISSLENGERNVGLVNVFRIANALKVSVSELMSSAETQKRRTSSRNQS